MDLAAQSLLHDDPLVDRGRLHRRRTGIQTFDELPENAKRYVDGLQDHLGVEIPLISTGPGREETIMRGNLL